MEIVAYGIDRIKLSVTGWILKNPDVEGELCGRQHGFDWYNCGMYRIGFSAAYAVLEYGSLWCALNSTGFTDFWASVTAHLDELFVTYSSPKISRLDAYIDRVGKKVSEFSATDYTGRAAVKTSTWKDANGQVETAYLQACSGSWRLRRYNKTKEISDNGTAHRYDDIYTQENVIRTEIEIGKDALKNMAERSFSSALALLEKLIDEISCEELKRLKQFLTSNGRVAWKASKRGQNNGQKTLESIIKAMEILHADYVAIAGNDRRMWAYLALWADKKISVEV